MVTTPATIQINGTVYTRDELITIVGADALQDPIDLARVQAEIDAANERRDALSDLLGALILLGAVTAIPASRWTYSRREGAYFRGRSRQSTPAIQRRIDTERTNAVQRMERYTDDLINGRSSLEQWQRNMATDIYQSHLRMAQAGAGTAASMTPEHIRRLSERMVGMRDGSIGELDALGRFAQQINDGDLSEAMIRARARRYGQNVGASYFEAEHVSRILEGGWEGQRQLDPGANHCPSCPNYQTNGYVPAADIVPVGVACECRGNCRCRVFWRRSLSDRLV